ncbi:MAG: SGNH/GDSL hydrolase family protein [Oceanipulchritudo sp.]
MLIEKNNRILFQGDSITDCGRDRSQAHSLGNGYAMMAASFLSAMHPELSPVFFNRGISGNRTGDLLARWEEDCLELKPDVLSLYIGINDVWRRYDRNLPTTAEQFGKNCRQLLEKTFNALPSVKLIIMEPFVLPVPEDRKAWREDLDPKIDAVRHLAREYGATYVPLDGIFAAASTRQEPAFWAPDGVHPSPAGHALIARSWLEAVGA